MYFISFCTTHTPYYQTLLTSVVHRSSHSERKVDSGGKERGRERESISSKRWGVGVGIGSSPGLLRGEGEGRPGIHCMRMHYICRIIYHKSVRTLIPTTCWQEKWSMCLKNMGWPPDLCTSDYAKRVPMLFRDLRWSIDNVALATSKSHLKFKLSKPAISRYIEH